MSRTRHHNQKKRGSVETWGAHGVVGWSGGVRDVTNCIARRGYDATDRRRERRSLDRIFRREIDDSLSEEARRG